MLIFVVWFSHYCPPIFWTISFLSEKVLFEKFFLNIYNCFKIIYIYNFLYSLIITILVSLRKLNFTFSLFSKTFITSVFKKYEILYFLWLPIWNYLTKIPIRNVEVCMTLEVTVNRAKFRLTRSNRLKVIVKKVENTYRQKDGKLSEMDPILHDSFCQFPPQEEHGVSGESF